MASITNSKYVPDGIIESNHLSFRISEIEGDAILFYRMGVPPSIAAILGQFARMRKAFKKVLQLYRPELPEVGQLEMKAIAHYGPMEEFKIDRFSKLYGNILVDAHRLLKNSIPSNAYVPLSMDYLEQMDNLHWITRRPVVPINVIYMMSAHFATGIFLLMK